MIKVFGLCPAVAMSLQYSINSEIGGLGTEIDRGYTLNVMVSGLGIFSGPILTGWILDKTQKSYEVVFAFATAFYLLALTAFICAKCILLKNARNNVDNKYIEFDQDESCY